MSTATATAFFTDLASEGNTPPEWIELFPKGPEIRARDGRRWTLEPARVVSAFAANNGPLAIDYEHGQAHKAPKGEEAKAAGWIVAVEERGGAVWGKAEWTPAAAAMIANREYRFISPDFDHTREGLIVHLNGAGLVNRPALTMTALSQRQPETDAMSLKAIAAALGLKDDADEKAVLTAIEARAREATALCAILKIDASSDAAAITTAVQTLQSSNETALASLKTAQGADVAALQAQLTDTRNALTALQNKDADREIDAALDQASSEGKITPASRETYRAMCAAEGGLERFKALAATLPVICAPSPLGGQPAVTADEATNLNPTALAAKARKYQDEQAATGIIVSISDAVEHVKAAG
jgi:phage I-like protein